MLAGNKNVSISYLFANIFESHLPCILRKIRVLFVFFFLYLCVFFLFFFGCCCFSHFFLFFLLSLSFYFCWYGVA